VKRKKREKKERGSEKKVKVSSSKSGRGGWGEESLLGYVHTTERMIP